MFFSWHAVSGFPVKAASPLMSRANSAYPAVKTFVLLLFLFELFQLPNVFLRHVLQVHGRVDRVIHLQPARRAHPLSFLRLLIKGAAGRAEMVCREVLRYAPEMLPFQHSRVPHVGKEGIPRLIPDPGSGACSFLLCCPFPDVRLLQIQGIRGIGYLPRRLVQIISSLVGSLFIALDVFAPNERCVTLVRLSRTGRRFKMSEIYANMLEEYRLYHGNTVGIVIRNGENVYIGWTDAEQVHVTDDFIMEVDPKAFHVNNDFIGQETEAERETRLIQERTNARQVAAELVSRIFIFNILQGIVDNSDLLPLPEGITISRESECVKFSMADKWLSDNRFGSFADIVERCNEPELHKGDTILTVQFLRPQYENRNIYRQWQNDRGRGEKNRTWDCSVSDCQVYPINLVEYDEPRQRTYYRYNGIRYVTNGDGSSLSKDAEIIETKWERDPHFFVSVKKTESNSGTARSNFEIYPDEVINLTYMNSVWLEYAINNRNLGGWVVGHQAVDYAYGIRYLNTALEHVRRREAEESALLNEADPTYISTHPEWPVQLSEWKLATGIRRLTPRSTKQFLRSLAQ